MAVVWGSRAAWGSRASCRNWLAASLNRTRAANPALSFSGQLSEEHAVPAESVGSTACGNWTTRTRRGAREMRLVRVRLLTTAEACVQGNQWPGARAKPARRLRAERVPVYCGRRTC